MKDEPEKTTHGNPAFIKYFETKESIQTLLKDLAEYYSYDLSKNKLDMYSDDLIDMGFDNTLKAIFSYRKRWSSKSFPLPCDLRREILFGLED